MFHLSGPFVEVPRSKMISVLCDGDKYNAGDYAVSANPFPDENEIQYSQFGTNKVCRLIGQSNIYAGGLKVC